MEFSQIAFHKTQSQRTKCLPYYRIFPHLKFQEPFVFKFLTILRGDPSMVSVFVSFSIILEKPKSAIFKLPLCFNILGSLKSLCIILYLVKVLKAFKI